MPENTLRLALDAIKSSGLLRLFPLFHPHFFLSRTLHVYLRLCRPLLKMPSNSHKQHEETSIIFSFLLNFATTFQEIFCEINFLLLNSPIHSWKILCRIISLRFSFHFFSICNSLRVWSLCNSLIRWFSAENFHQLQLSGTSKRFLKMVHYKLTYFDLYGRAEHIRQVRLVEAGKFSSYSFLDLCCRWTRVRGCANFPRGVACTQVE